MNTNLKKLIRFIYSDKDKCYHLDKNHIIDMTRYPIEKINNDFIKLNKLHKNNFAFSLINLNDIPKKAIFTGSRLCECT